MRRFFLLLAVLIQLVLPQRTFAVDEVVLDFDEYRPEEEDVVSENETKELTLYEKIQNIRAKEYKDNSKVEYLFEDILTKEFETGIVKDVHLFGYYRQGLNMDIPEHGDSDFMYNLNVLQAGIKTDFRDDKTKFEATFRFNGQHQYNFMQFLPANLYVSNTSIPHHTIIFGNTRTPSGVEGGTTPLLIPFFMHSQIGRNFGNIRKFGLRVQGSYPLIDYDLGGYSSDTYFRKFFPGAEFTGQVMLKPLGKTDGKYGSLNIGGGISAGHNEFNYFVSNLYAKYEYKKAFVDFEWATANGYNGNGGLVDKRAEGFYTTLGYNITPKLQAVVRYDEFTPDKNFSGIKKREYSAGLNWFIKGQALKMMLNYVFCQNDNAKDSHRIILGTQILL